MAYGKRRIFALDVIYKPMFAFEAESLAQAEYLVRAPWFAEALTEFHLGRRGVQNQNALPQTRVATEAEAAIYHDFADEFAEHSDQFLVAHLPDGCRLGIAG